MTSKEIRDSYIKFFQQKNHKFVPSSAVAPLDDPSLLFINAGMNQFKNIFLNVEKRDYIRAVNSQKCIRVSGKHNDLEEVGKDTYHHTFFEMLGNWSFGDYYKKEAITWAWELLTEVWKLPKTKLWATVYRDDDEAEELWKKVTDINKNQILRFDEKDNFWEMGEVGPCGPCSEIHIDLGDLACDKKHIPGHKCEVNGSCARYMEFWNLVFIQYNREQDRSLVELPAKHVDTGMGFERITAIIQGVGSNYETDLFLPILEKVGELTGKEYSSDDRGTAHRVIADHVRTLTFAIADGVLPSNEGRGYVLRRILRRAARFARTLDFHEPIIYKLVPTIIDIMGQAYPEIIEKHQYVSMVIKSEEEGFNNTVDRGIELFDKLILDLKKKGIKQIPGKEAFKLYDTYGFPFDLTQLMAEENQFTVDEKGFQKEMEVQRKRARDAGKWEYAVDFNYDTWEIITTGIDSQFIGYEDLETNSTIRKVKREENFIFLTLDKTPFYGEAGGQVGDKGEILGANFKLLILNTICEGEKIIHIAQGDLPKKEINPHVTAQVNRELRLNTARNHTATHLLQAALREVLGKHVQQSGSLVAPDHFRFDLTHFEKISKNQLKKIEEIVNQKIWDNYKVDAVETSLEDARKEGAMMLFGEKYDEKVRMIKINDYSKELCGGTHLGHTGQIGSFRIIHESSVASGIRRIEAVTGAVAYSLTANESSLLNSIKERLSTQADGLLDRIDSLINEKKVMARELFSLKAESARGEIVKLVGNAKILSGFKLVTKQVECPDVDNLKQLGDLLREELKSGVGVLSAIINGKINFICVITDDIVKDRKLSANDVVKQVAAIAGGSGGGRPHIALAGAKNLDKLNNALQGVEPIIKQKLKL